MANVALRSPLTILKHPPNPTLPHRFNSSSSPQTLLSHLLNHGEIHRAHHLFDQIPHPNLTLWSIMIHGLAKNRLYSHSLRLFSAMRRSGLPPNSFAAVALLAAVAGLQSPPLTASVHGVLFKSGLDSHPFVATALLDAYAKSGSVAISCEIFNQIDDPGLVSRSAMLAGFVRNDLHSEALRSFVEFRRIDPDFLPNPSTAISLIQACIGCRSWRICESAHALAIKLRLIEEIRVRNALLNMYSSFQNLNGAWKIFRSMEIKDAASYSTMIGMLNDLEHGVESINLFLEMKMNKIEYDQITVLNLIAACTVIGDLDLGKQVQAQVIVHGFASDPTMMNSIIAMNAKCGDLEHAIAVFDPMGARTAASWGAIISGFARSDFPHEAMNFFHRFRSEEAMSMFDVVIMVSALKAVGELACFALVRQLQSLAFRAGFSRYRSVANSLVSAYSKSGSVPEAGRVFNEMEVGIRDVVSWNAIINGFGINGHGRTALLFFHDMLKSQVEPDDATYLCVITACSHSGLVEDGLEVVEKMVKDGRVALADEHFCCVIDLLARAGRLSDWSALVSRSLEERMTASAWKALLSGCLRYGNAGLAEYAAKRFRSLDERGADESVLISNALASSGRFEESEGWRSSIVAKGLTKNPGISHVSGS